MDKEQVNEIEAKIVELKRRWPAHSVPPQLWLELEDLERELEQPEPTSDEETDGG
jgi:hypothetical protein